MKSIRLRCAATLVSMMALCAVPNVVSLGTLKEISTPYVGFYNCESLRIGNRDFTEQADATLELGADGEGKVRYKNAFGKEQTVSFTYVYDAEKGVLTAEIPDGKQKKKVHVPFEKGESVFSENLSGRAFFAKFTRK